MRDTSKKYSVEGYVVLEVQGRGDAFKTNSLSDPVAPGDGSVTLPHAVGSVCRAGKADEHVPLLQAMVLFLALVGAAGRVDEDGLARLNDHIVGSILVAATPARL